MVITETITLNNREFTRNYSNSGYYIERDGVMYSEAIDLINSGRVYTETDKLIEEVGESSNDDYAEAGKILLGVSE